MPQEDNNLFQEKALDFIQTELAKSSPTGRKRAIEKFVLAALGSIPWVGGYLSAAVSFKMEEGEVRANNLRTQWLQEHAKKIEHLMQALKETSQRFETLGPEIETRLQDENYLKLVRRAFRSWDKADTEQKRRYVCNIVTNAAGTRLCADDVIRLFIDWLDLYHEAHFAVIQEIYKNPGVTRYEIWTNLYGELPRENSAEADLFKLLIRDLSTGGVIRQERDTNELGQFVRRTPQRRRASSTHTTMESAFEDSKPYVLTDLGKQFVHYTMNEVVQRIEQQNSQSL